MKTPSVLLLLRLHHVEDKAADTTITESKDNISLGLLGPEGERTPSMGGQHFTVLINVKTPTLAGGEARLLQRG